MAEISLTGLSVNDPVPGFYIQTNFAQGPAAGSGSARTALLIGNMTSAGMATPDTVIYGPDTSTPIQLEQDWINYFGAGSPLHRAMRRFVKINGITSLYGLAVTASNGAAAIGWISVTGTASGVGNIRVWVTDTFQDTLINNGDTPTTICTNVVANLNTHSEWPVTATATGGVTSFTVTNPGSGYTSAPTVMFSGGGGSGASAIATIAGNMVTGITVVDPGTGYTTAPTISFSGGGGSSAAATATVTQTVRLQAKVKGPRGNYISYQSLVTAGITTAATASTDSFLVNGVTADSNVTALGTIDASKYYYIISEAGDATQFGALASQVGLQALPVTGIRQRCFAGSQDTLSNTITIATGINNPRAEVEWQQASDWTPFEVAANNAALFALLENSGPKPRHNFCDFPSQAPDVPLWVVPPQRNQGVWPSRASQSSALNNGITPIRANTNGTTSLVRRITSYSLTNSVNDYRVRDAHKVTEVDFYGDDLYAILTQNFGGKDLGDDPPQGTQPPGPNVATPLRVESSVDRLTLNYGEDDRMKNADVIVANTIVQRETNPTDRMSILVPLTPIDIFATGAVLLNQVG